ncbi:acyl-[acyl-carrier-protein] thioesterase [Anaerosporobacter sp.]|uniref:acyl-[acyl-carrier-protein] thioesterase n=1 Tax=Anaerosporobacter sp. TaxID=1872529 RepID=UPI00286F3C2F|nr:acyl-ACP thioesterase domain-containing protein [Anaerosporobacter sp.]
MYSFTSRIRYSEVDINKKLDLAAIINYFQDCTTFHSEDLQIGIEHMSEMNFSWMLSSWQIIINRSPVYGETITTTTWPYGFDSMFGYRNFTITDTSNAVCAYANSIWILVDLNTGHPIKLTNSITSAYPLEDGLDMEYAPRKIKLPKESQEEQPIQVVRSFLDTNNHVNNGQYIKIAEEFLPKDFIIHEMRADYRTSALLGDTIIPKCSITDKECIVTLCQPDGKPYAIIQFIAQ